MSNSSDGEEALELALRVEAAIKRLDGRMRESEKWVALVAEWRDCVRRHGPGSASARGCLLGLVRLAQGIPSLRCGHVGGWDPSWNMWEVDNPPGRGRGCFLGGHAASETEAMLVALERDP